MTDYTMYKITCITLEWCGVDWGKVGYIGDGVGGMGVDVLWLQY